MKLCTAVMALAQQGCVHKQRLGIIGCDNIVDSEFTFSNMCRM